MIWKVCGITNPDDALAAIDAGANALGFNFYTKSPRFLDPQRDLSWISTLPREVLRAGVFVNQTPEIVLRTVSSLGLDLAQLHGDETPDAIPDGLRVWKAFRVGAGFDWEQTSSFAVEAVLLDGPAGALYGGGGEAFDWRRGRNPQLRVIIAGGLDETNVASAIEQAQPWGIDACSRLESAPGRKDHVRMRQFLKAAKAAIA